MEATAEQSAEGALLVRVLASVLDRLVAKNVSLARTDPGQVTKFHAMKAPSIGIQLYLERIYKYASCSNECFILALIYIDRLIQRSNFLLTELNVHRVVVTAVLLAAKFFDDAYYNNAYYAKVGGVLVSEMNGLEVDFLFRINFSLHVPTDEFRKYRMELFSQVSCVSGDMSPVSVIWPLAEPALMQKPPCHPCLVDQQLMEQDSLMNHAASIVTAAQVTPSPTLPVQNEYMDVFPRASFSDPSQPLPLYPPSALRCAQLKSFSASSQPYQEDGYVVVDHRIYTPQGV